MKAATYSLTHGGKNSGHYYNVARDFTDLVLVRSTESLTPIVEEYVGYLREFNLEKIRTTEEYLLELISFGVLWRTYSHVALSVKIAPFITLARMAEWRKKHQRIKPLIDFARGIMLTLFLLPKSNRNSVSSLPSLEQVDHVCKWFEATGEFKEQALRFVRWRAFWATKQSDELTKIFSAINEFINWFEENTDKALGMYTENVEMFLQQSSSRYHWREDRISCSRKRIEYHLNMVGAELMNRAFRPEFKQTNAKVVLLPGCMRYHNDDECEAVRVREGLICQGCVAECRVNQLREMGKKNNFDVYIIPHASDLSLWGPRPDRPARGVIASACVTTLVEGGWELKRYDVPAQCVLLDYSGCKKHWHGSGIETELNIRELKRILN